MAMPCAMAAWLFLSLVLVLVLLPHPTSAVPQPEVLDPSVQLELHATMEDHIGNVKTLFFPRSTDYTGSAILVVYRGGVLRMYPDIDSLPQFPGDNPPGNQILLDLSDDTYSLFDFSDHGMTSAAIHPNWPETPYVYAWYVAKQPGLPSWWGRANQGQRDTYDTFDRCPNIPDFFNEFDCRKRSKLVRVRIEYDQATDTFSNPNGVGEVDQLLLEGFCSESNTHGTGDLLFLDDGNLLFTHGDTGKAEANDPGVLSTGQLGECSLGPNADIPMPKGAFLSQQPLSLAGKMWAIPPQSQTRNRVLGMDDLEQVAWGFRNPFRFTPGPDNNIFLSDVGFGTAEEVNELVNPSGSAYDTVANYGWPCLEGSTHEEQARKDYLEALDFDICDAIYDDPTASIRPRYEYRGGVMDPQHPTLCTEGRASISAVYHTQDQATALPAKFQNKLFFSDQTKHCTFYFDNNADGSIDFSAPRILSGNIGGTQIFTDPYTGIMYLQDYLYSRMFKLTASGAPTPAPVAPAPTPPPTVVSNLGVCERWDSTPVAQCPGEGGDPTCVYCKRATDMCSADSGEVEWTRQGGEFRGTVRFVETSFFDSETETLVNTRTFDGVIPGPTMRMQACNTYRLTVVNELSPGDNPGGPTNAFKDPKTMNIHTHGLHISGVAPADYPGSEIGPGETYQYLYRVPCDHSGGTFWYHTHHHGSVSLTTGAGAAAPLIVEDNANVEGNGMPAAYGNMQEHVIMMQEFKPDETNDVALASADKIWYASTTDDFYLVNGCLAQPGGGGAAPQSISAIAGRWTKLRLLYAGHEENALVAIKGGDCEVSVLAKDGVYLSSLPRMLPKTAGETLLFFTPSSRVDVAVSCSAGTYEVVLKPATKDVEVKVATLTVTGSGGAGTLPQWQPCRAPYLQDLTTRDVDETYLMSVREDINGELFDGYANPLRSWEADEVYELIIQGSTGHPFHGHVNHFQVVDVDTPVLALQDWHQPGDWIDTIAADGGGVVRQSPHDFRGTVLYHCHVLTHSDNGIMAVTNVVGGIGPRTALNEDYSQVVCPGQAPAPTPPPTPQPAAPPTAGPTTPPTSPPTSPPTAPPTPQPTATPTAPPTSPTPTPPTPTPPSPTPTPPTPPAGDACAARCSAAEPCYTEPRCTNGGGISLGCGALGESNCRFCGFGGFSSITCGTATGPTPTPPTPTPPTPTPPTPTPPTPTPPTPTPPTPTPPTPTPPTPTPPSPTPTPPTPPAGDACAARCSTMEPCYTEPRCTNGGGISLGCGALGESNCRFCGFGGFSAITCGTATGPTPTPPTPTPPTPTPPTPTPPTPTPPTPTPPSPTPTPPTPPAGDACAARCSTMEPCYTEPRCTNGGGISLGCGALGESNCRFCGFGGFSAIPCGPASRPPSPTPPVITPPTSPSPPPPTPPSPPSPPSPSTDDPCAILCGTTEPCYTEPRCTNGGGVSLGCSALSEPNCRFCGFGPFSATTCP